MKEYTYIPIGVCSKKMIFKIENNKIIDIDVIGGCPGNLLGIKELCNCLIYNYSYYSS